jgi:hypothetical protein
MDIAGFVGIQKILFSDCLKNLEADGKFFGAVWHLDSSLKQSWAIVKKHL